MAEDYGDCPLCKKGKMQLIRKEVVAATAYNILKCDKCSHQIARSE